MTQQPIALNWPQFQQQLRGHYNYLQHHCQGRFRRRAKLAHLWYEIEPMLQRGFTLAAVEIPDATALFKLNRALNRYYDAIAGSLFGKSINEQQRSTQGGVDYWLLKIDLTDSTPACRQIHQLLRLYWLVRLMPCMGQNSTATNDWLATSGLMDAPVVPSQQSRQDHPKAQLMAILAGSANTKALPTLLLAHNDPNKPAMGFNFLQWQQLLALKTLQQALDGFEPNQFAQLIETLRQPIKVLSHTRFIAQFEDQLLALPLAHVLPPDEQWFAQQLPRLYQKLQGNKQQLQRKAQQQKEQIKSTLPGVLNQSFPWPGLTDNINTLKQLSGNDPLIQQLQRVQQFADDVLSGQLTIKGFIGFAELIETIANHLTIDSDSQLQWIVQHSRKMEQIYDTLLPGFESEPLMVWPENTIKDPKAPIESLQFAYDRHMAQLLILSQPEQQLVQNSVTTPYHQLAKLVLADDLLSLLSDDEFKLNLPAYGLIPQLRAAISQRLEKQLSAALAMTHSPNVLARRLAQCPNIFINQNLRQVIELLQQASEFDNQKLDYCDWLDELEEEKLNLLYPWLSTGPLERLLTAMAEFNGTDNSDRQLQKNTRLFTHLIKQSNKCHHSAIILFNYHVNHNPAQKYQQNKHRYLARMDKTLNGAKGRFHQIVSHLFGQQYLNLDLQLQDLLQHDLTGAQTLASHVYSSDVLLQGLTYAIENSETLVQIKRLIEFCEQVGMPLPELDIFGQYRQQLDAKFTKLTQFIQTQLRQWQQGELFSLTLLIQGKALRSDIEESELWALKRLKDQELYGLLALWQQLDIIQQRLPLLAELLDGKAAKNVFDETAPPAAQLHQLEQRISLIDQAASREQAHFNVAFNNDPWLPPSKILTSLMIQLRILYPLLKRARTAFEQWPNLLPTHPTQDKVDEFLSNQQLQPLLDSLNSQNYLLQCTKYRDMLDALLPQAGIEAWQQTILQRSDLVNLIQQYETAKLDYGFKGGNSPAPWDQAQMEQVKQLGLIVSQVIVQL